MFRATLTTGLALVLAVGPRFCCLLTLLTAAHPETCQAGPSQPPDPERCGCCHHKTAPSFPSPSEPEPRKCPFEERHDEGKAMLPSPDQAKPVNGPGSGECYTAGAWQGLVPAFGYAPAAGLTAAFNSSFPFLLPADVLHLLCAYRC